MAQISGISDEDVANISLQAHGNGRLSAPQVDRGAQHLYAPNEEIVRFGTPEQFQQFWVGIMQGDPKNRGTGLVHRSPPVAGSGITRVVFCLDG